MKDKIIDILGELVDEVTNANEFEFGYLRAYATRIMELSQSKEECANYARYKAEVDYMTKRKLIRGFVRWQLRKDMIDPLTIDYEAAESYLDDPEEFISPKAVTDNAIYCTTCKSTFNRGLKQDYCPSCNYYSLKYVNNGK